MEVLKGGIDKTISKKVKRKKIREERFREMYYDSIYYSEYPDLKKAALCGVKYAILHVVNTETTYRDMLGFFIEMREITNIISKLTYRDMIQIFPIGKDFDGKKFEAKDYYSTIEWLKDKDIDSVIGEDVDDFLWTYYNSDIMSYGVKQTLCCDKLMRADGKQGMIESFLKEVDPEHKIHTYRINVKEGYIYDNMTGKTQKYRRPKKKCPKYIKVVE